MFKNFIIGGIAILTVVTFSLLVMMEYQLGQPLKIKQTELIKVDSGASVSKFAQQLVDKGWVSNRFWLRNYTRLHPDLAKLKAGTYQIAAGTTVKQLLSQLVEGKEYNFTVTFIEGTIFKQWLVELAKHRQIKKLLVGKTEQEILALLELDIAHPEGWFFPDTYSFTAGTTDIEILKRAHNKMRDTLMTEWQQRSDNLPYTEPYQALILASIIEKETGQLDEQGLIASVFVNRLRRNMRLQTDPTVIYGLGNRYQGDIKRAHLREETAYNTYRIKGLPPTPIAMPGLSAIKASVQPAISDYLYFVSQGNGRHVFSKNIHDHNRAVTRYQLGINK